MHRLRKIPPKGPTPNDAPSSESYVGMVENIYLATLHNVIKECIEGKLLWGEVR